MYLVSIGSAVSEHPVTAYLADVLHGVAGKGIKAATRWLAKLTSITVVATSAIVLAGASASAGDRSLKLFFTHTGERATFTFKRDGKFDPNGLAQINRFLRDWRRNEPARMDPRLLDLVWEVYQRSGANGYINIVSAYRSPATNTMLRGRSRNTGVAMQMQIGGVGYYPTSGSPFVHLDVGRVRAWPRMSRQELVTIFPNGNTLHVPADGKPLPGYDVAMADYKRRVGSKSVVAAGTAGASPSREDASSPTDSLVTALLPTRKSRAERALELQTSPSKARQPAYVDLATISAPLPSFPSFRS